MQISEEGAFSFTDADMSVKGIVTSMSISFLAYAWQVAHLISVPSILCSVTNYTGRPSKGNRKFARYYVTVLCNCENLE